MINWNRYNTRRPNRIYIYWVSAVGVKANNNEGNNQLNTWTASARSQRPRQTAAREKREWEKERNRIEKVFGRRHCHYSILLFIWHFANRKLNLHYNVALDARSSVRARVHSHDAHSPQDRHVASIYHSIFVKCAHYYASDRNAHFQLPRSSIWTSFDPFRGRFIGDSPCVCVCMCLVCIRVYMLHRIAAFFHVKMLTKENSNVFQQNHISRLVRYIREKSIFIYICRGAVHRRQNRTGAC